MSEQELPEFEELYPQGEDAEKQISTRQRVGRGWSMGFLGATAIAVVVLTILLITIVNQSAGYVAEQSAVPEEQLITDYNKSLLMNGPNVVAMSEDDQALADGIASDPGGVGFFGYAYYAQNVDKLQLVSIDGIVPSAETTASGEYIGTRPLSLYTSVEIIKDKPQVGAFILYYLQHADEVMAEIGYFPADPVELEAQAQQIVEALGLESLPTINPADYEGDLRITGSSTVYPVTLEMAKRFRREGFKGGIKLDSTGTGAGFDAFCGVTEEIDIVDASRPVSQLESKRVVVMDFPYRYPGRYRRFGGGC
ncbi:MAG: hypothetical protein R3C44_13155 [Chloroflexota bacterium]